MAGRAALLGSGGSFLGGHDDGAVLKAIIILARKDELPVRKNQNIRVCVVCVLGSDQRRGKRNVAGPTRLLYRATAVDPGSPGGSL